MVWGDLPPPHASRALPVLVILVLHLLQVICAPPLPVAPASPAPSLPPKLQLGGKGDPGHRNPPLLGTLGALICSFLTQK